MAILLKSLCFALWLIIMLSLIIASRRIYKRKKSSQKADFSVSK